MKYIYIILFVAIFILFGTEIGYTIDSPLYTHLSYMFQHSSIAHLVINSLSFIALFRMLERHFNKWILSVLIITSSFIASFTSGYDIPTVGASAMIYTMIGLFLGFTSTGYKMKIADTKKYLLFITVIILSLIISFFNSHSNSTLHIYSIMIGFIISFSWSIINENKLP